MDLKLFAEAAGCRLTIKGRATWERPRRLPALTVKGHRALEVFRHVFARTVALGHDFSRIPLARVRDQAIDDERGSNVSLKRPLALMDAPEAELAGGALEACHFLLGRRLRAGLWWRGAFSHRGRGGGGRGAGGGGTGRCAQW